MTQLYEGMFLLDNQAVRADWGAAKAAVTDALAKHGGKLLTARRWDERRLAYPIRGRQRATYLLAYFEQDGDGARALRRDLEIDERVLRYLILSSEAVPEGESELSQAELEAGFSVPTPPTDDEPPPAEAEAAPPAEAGATPSTETAPPAETEAAPPVVAEAAPPAETEAAPPVVAEAAPPVETEAPQVAAQESTEEKSEEKV